MRPRTLFPVYFADVDLGRRSGRTIANGWRVYFVEEDGTIGQTEHLFRDREDAHRKVCQLNEWESAAAFNL